MSNSSQPTSKDSPIQRKAPRYAVNASMTISGSHGDITGTCVNLSSGGLCGEIGVALENGSAVTISLTLVFDQGDISEPLALPARNVWCTGIGTKFQVGFQFVSLTPQQKSFLKLFLGYLERG